MTKTMRAALAATLLGGLAIGGAAGLAASPFLDPGGSWIRPICATGLVLVIFTRRGRLHGAGLALAATTTAIAGSVRTATERPPRCWRI